MDVNVSADAGVTSTELTVADAAAALSREFQGETAGPVETSPPADEKKPEPPSLTNNTKVALKDGTEVSITELKRGYMSRRTFTQKTQALADERARLDDLRSATEKQAQLVDESRQLLSILVGFLPQQPDHSLIEADPQEYKRQYENFEFAKGLIQRAEQTAQAELKARQAAQAAAMQDEIIRKAQEKQQQQTRLSEAMPELKDPISARKFRDDAIACFAHYGFPAEDVESAFHDERIFRATRDLIFLGKARSKAPAVKEAVQSLPVMTGKRRMDPKDRSSRATQTELEQLRSSGRLEVAGAILARRMKD